MTLCWLLRVVATVSPSAVGAAVVGPEARLIKCVPVSARAEPRSAQPFSYSAAPRNRATGSSVAIAGRDDDQIYCSSLNYPIYYIWFRNRKESSLLRKGDVIIDRKYTNYNNTTQQLLTCSLKLSQTSQISPRSKMHLSSEAYQFRHLIENKLTWSIAVVLNLGSRDPLGVPNAKLGGPKRKSGISTNFPQYK